MTEGPPSRPEKPKAFWWLAGRAGRAEYWLWVGLLIALGFGLSYIPGFGNANTGLSVVLLFIQIRRVHDFGRTGWWAVAATLAPIVIMLPLLAVTSLTVATIVGIALELALLIWIGAVRGDAGDNRFGPPGPFTWRRALLGR